MARASIAGTPPRRTSRPWTQLCVDALPVPPAWAGVGFTLLHLCLAGAYHAVFVTTGPDPSWGSFRQGLPSTSIFALLVGYAIAALAYARRGHEAGLRELRPALRVSDAEFGDILEQVRSFRMGLLRAAGAISALIALLVTLFTTSLLERFGTGHPLLYWVLWQNAVAFWLVARAIAHDLTVSWVFSRTAARHAAVDPFDSGPLEPLARRGLQSALLIILAISIFSLILGAGDASPLVPYTQLSTLLVAGFALALPSLGVHVRLRAGKRAEVARLNTQLRTLRARGDDAPRDDARLVTLLTLRAQAEGAREWPFDLGTLGRFGLYAAIGVGSWLGGALAERLLDLLLG